MLGVLGRLSGTIDTQLGTIVLVAGGAAVINALVGMINERGWYRWWFIYMLALLDVVLVNVLVLWFGPGGVIAALFIAVLPYAFDQGQTVGDFLVLVTSVAYLFASWLHGGLDTSAYLETGVFIVVAMTLKRIPATLIQRIRRARSVMGEAEQGFLAVRAAAAEADELGFLEKSFNRMLEEIAATISSVQREADEGSPRSWRLPRSNCMRQRNHSRTPRSVSPAISAISADSPMTPAAKAPRPPTRRNRCGCAPS